MTSLRINILLWCYIELNQIKLGFLPFLVSNLNIRTKTKHLIVRFKNQNNEVKLILINYIKYDSLTVIIGGFLNFTEYFFKYITAIVMYIITYIVLP